MKEGFSLLLISTAQPEELTGKTAKNDFAKPVSSAKRGREEGLGTIPVMKEQAKLTLV